MPRLAFVTKIVAKPGQREALKRLNEGMCAQSRSEPGTLVYVMSQARENPDEFWYFDVYADQAAFDEHCASAVYRDMIAKLGGLAAEIEGHPLAPFAAVGFDTP
jgi:quinol monooxygenase YgiN